MVKKQVKDRIELAKLFASLDFKNGAEVGVHDGRYSEILCQNIPGLKLLCIDIWDHEPVFQTAKRKLAPYNATLIRKTSMDAVHEIADESLDFVFIDADHQYKSVKEDIEAWSKKVRKGGVISGHDYYVFQWSGNRGVIDAVDEYVKENKHHLYFTIMGTNKVYGDDRPPIWYFFK